LKKEKGGELFLEFLRRIISMTPSRTHLDISVES